MIYDFDEAEHYENKLDCDFRYIRCGKLTNNGMNKKNGGSKRNGKQIKADIRHEIDSYIKGCGLYFVRAGNYVEMAHSGIRPRRELHQKNRRNKYRRANERKKSIQFHRREKVQN